MTSFRIRLAVAAVCLAATSCASQSTTPAGLQLPAHRKATTANPITHIVLVVQENRSFDNLFATFPGADGATSGYYLKKTKTGLVKTPVQLQERPLDGGLDLNHASQAYNDACDGADTYPKTSCAMDGFNFEGIKGNSPAGLYAYQYIDPNDIKQYWKFARNYGLADYFFQTQGSGSFTAHQDLVAGGTNINDTACGTSDPLCAVIDYPGPKNFTNWGCGAPAGTTTNLLTQQGQYLAWAGPFPCLTYPTPTMRDLFDGAGVTWKYYTPPYVSNTSGAMWDAFAAISEVYNGPEWGTNVSMPECNIFSDLTNGTLPQFSWVIPEEKNSDHPGGPKTVDHGPEWVGAVVDAVGESQYWKSTAIAVVWDDWGGFYDHEPPAFFDDMGGLGFRVPLLLISPYVPKGEISHTQYEFASVLKFAEQTFNLGSMGTTDVRATSISNMFDFGQKPRKFVPVHAPAPNTFCKNGADEAQPVDRE